MNDKDIEGLKSIRDFIRFTVTRLINSQATFLHGYDNPVDEATFLILRSLSIPLEYEQKFLDCRLTAEEKDRLAKVISDRCDLLVPTAYLTHEWWLTGHPFYVDERVLIPRSFIAELLEEELRPWVQDPNEVKSVLDLCTGSGCLAIIASETFPNAVVDAADISIDALDVARKNIEDYGLEDIVTPVESDLFSNLPEKKYDIIISNPPYVTEASMGTLPGEYRHEPQIALGAGEDGMDIVRRIMASVKDHLNDGGMLFMEIGDGREAFEKVFPNLPVMWLSTSGGDDMVFMVKKEDLP